MNREEILQLVLSGKSLSGADLSGADFSWANLTDANLTDANLSGANLSRANLIGANLSRANLSGANLIGANLFGANLYGANLSWANLYGANLSWANLSGSCLDPKASANADVEGFERDGELVIGYRTRNTKHIGSYLDGRTYSADFFSVSETECHPGLYLWPTMALAIEYEPNQEIIKVLAPAAHTHHAGAKWRTRWFTVVGSVDIK